jgi:oligopeptidase B
MAAKIPARVRKHRDPRVDEYAWLRQKTNPEVIRYLQAENAYTASRMQATRKLQQKLFNEMRRRIKETDLDVPVRIDDYYYYSRTRKGKQYSIFCRKHGSLRAREEIVLDQNQLARGHKYFQLGFVEISVDHRLLAFGTDIRGDERFTLHLKDLTTGKLRRDSAKDVGSVAWATDNRTFFYTTLDATHRPYKVFRHRVGQPARSDALVYHEKDDAFFAGVSVSRSRKFIFLGLHAKTTSEMRFLRADRPESSFHVVQPRRRHLEYDIEHHGDHFYVVHNHHAKNFKLSRTPVRSPSMAHWRTVIPHRKDVMIEDISAFEQHLVIYERTGGLRRVIIRDLAHKTEHHVHFPEPVYHVSEGDNPEFNTRTLRFTYTSLVTPVTVFDYDMTTHRRKLMKQTPVLGGFRPERYCTERVFATAKDGKRVPISLVYRKGLRRNGRNPMVLTGYGSYGLSRDPVFGSTRLSLLNRGVIYAIAHIRGGSEMGRSWYEDGKFLRKKNTFKDFIACAETLIRRRYTSPEKLAINGGSAGGLLMGAVVNMRPDLFGVVVADVPFVDVVNTMLDPTLPLTVIEYDEWGNPNDKKYYRYMKSYAPYENVRPQDYPTMLVTAGLNDPRVSYWEPAKWVARLRALKTDNNELLLKTEMGAGHFGASGRYEMLKEIAFEYAFILTRLSVE